MAIVTIRLYALFVYGFCGVHSVNIRRVLRWYHLPMDLAGMRMLHSDPVHWAHQSTSIPFLPPPPSHHLSFDAAEHFVFTMHIYAGDNILINMRRTVLNMLMCVFIFSFILRLHPLRPAPIRSSIAFSITVLIVYLIIYWAAWLLLLGYRLCCLAMHFSRCHFVSALCIYISAKWTIRLAATANFYFPHSQ